jgi:hypothetical protein
MYIKNVHYCVLVSHVLPCSRAIDIGSCLPWMRIRYNDALPGIADELHKFPIHYPPK